ncbi:hypothetical protein [Maribellus sp. YY47]|uniref:hypothetical protein n=1 Tax=Maribellus sp. YY47 TaxID=2929486 RepID=UPI0020007E0E|nr:hypothetical protein [Maribellus sp. YY47]MCK3686245.1 hypothetical protein [Maribellus sp. YY47]
MKYLILLAVLVTGISASAQQAYKYVIIPTYFRDFGDELNPFGISSTIQAELDKHSIKGVFEYVEIPDDYCETLTVNVEKKSNVLKNKLKIELRDCMNQVIWENEGTGRSKEYRAGFGEAVVDALKDLNQLPENKTKNVTPQKEPVRANITTVTESEKQTVEEGQNYKPQNGYYNSTYLVDLIDAANNKKELLILNGETLGYKKQQTIATLTPSGLDGVFTVSWMKSDGSTITGIARLTGDKLEVSLNNDGKEEVIELRKL